MGYDVIGDVHGQAGKLQALLRGLGYTPLHGSWRPPPGRQAVFVGDLIDRGPEQVAVVNLVRAMVDAGHARVVMGNHELNALGYVVRRPEAPQQFLRAHSATNCAQHAEFLRQVGEGSALHQEVLGWLRTLPLTLDLGAIRVVHAWWHQPHVDQALAWRQQDPLLQGELLHAAFTPGTPQFQAIGGLTKGLEMPLPAGARFLDHGGHARDAVRVRWWQPEGRSYRDMALVQEDQRHAIPDLPLAAPVVSDHGSVPTFIGHYWMTGTPAVLTPTVACVDYSAGRDGPLVAYRWDGEPALSADRFFSQA
ncbi:metallophosphoesterase [Aquincola tertiaricarbonis]|uniref:metallophosphoesterase n=1 Tax=Aquincola tertiaricarbonis TaxID=391953 RepID=UPI0006149F8B|nr:metallophosphoesterase [Aquincola tertiaricarbonis]